MIRRMKVIYFSIFLTLFVNCVASEQDFIEPVELDIKSHHEGISTDSEVINREEEAIKIDALSIAQLKELQAKAEKHVFQTEVNRMMKLIINSLYKNKEIFLRELISNASDALDKIRLMSLTNKEELETNPDLYIKIKADKENRVLHIYDTGIGMTKTDLINNLGTIARSGTADFLEKMTETTSGSDLSDMIGQFGVGFYSAFLVADRVVVTTKHNADDQHIWESDSTNFSIAKHPEGNTLKRGTHISLYLKEESQDFLEEDRIKELVKKYSQFINFPIFLWSNKIVEEDIPVETPTDKDESNEPKNEEEVDVEDETDSKATTKKSTTTLWDWERINLNKPIWTKKPSEVSHDEYVEFYKSLKKDTSDPLTYTHFVAEGEVTFKSLLFIPKVQLPEAFNRYGTKTDNIKLYVRRVFITDEFNDMMPSYLSFIRGIVDSDDLPLNVSRETLQQHKLIKVIKKKLVRKVIDMIKKINNDEYSSFWKEYSTNIKLGIMEDPSNRSRLAKLLRFQTSMVNDTASLAEYVDRMQKSQEHIYYIAGATREEVEKSPFVERLIAHNFEVLYLTDAVDEYAIAALPEFDGKKFQNAAKEGLSIPETEEYKAKLTEIKKNLQPLITWLQEKALKGDIEKAVVSTRLKNSPCALVAGVFGWTGNMERLALSNAHKKTDDPQRSYYLNQKKTFEINPQNRLIKELFRKIKNDENDESAKRLAKTLYDTATLRSGYMLRDTADYTNKVYEMILDSLDISSDVDDMEDESMIEDYEKNYETKSPIDDDQLNDHDEL